MATYCWTASGSKFKLPMRMASSGCLRLAISNTTGRALFTWKAMMAALLTLGRAATMVTTWSVGSRARMLSM